MEMVGIIVSENWIDLTVYSIESSLLIPVLEQLRKLRNHPFIEAGTMQLAKAIETFLLRCGKAKNTLKHYMRTMDLLVEVWGENLDIRTLTISKIRDLKEWMMDAQLSKAMVNQHLFNLRAFLKYFSQNYDFKVLDYKSIAIEPPKNKSWGYLTLEEVSKIRKAIRDLKQDEFRMTRDLLLVEVLLSTGLRREEMRNVKLDDIDMIRSEISLIGKGSKPGKVFLTTRAKQIIKIYLKLRPTCNSPYLLVANINGGDYHQINSGFIGKRFRLWGKKSGVKNCHPHALRKSFATFMYDAGADIFTISRLARHEQINTTTKYIISSEAKDKRDHSMYLGRNQRFTFEEKREGKVLLRAEIFCAEGISTQRAKKAMQEAIKQLLDT